MRVIHATQNWSKLDKKKKSDTWNTCENLDIRVVFCVLLQVLLLLSDYPI